MIYLIGICFSIITGRLLRSTLLKGEDAPFVMELPPYRMPMLKSLLIHMWDRSKFFLRRMGGVILIGSIVVWGLATFPLNITYSKDYTAEIQSVQVAFEIKTQKATDTERPALEAQREAAIHDLERSRQSEKMEKSLMGRIGKVMAPVFQPLGIDWRGSVALLTGFFAKEIVVSAMGIIYAAQDDSAWLQSALIASNLTPLSAFALMVFVLLYLPCLATAVTIRRETGSSHWTVFSIVYSTLLAWVVAFVIYQGGKLIGLS